VSAARAPSLVSAGSPERGAALLAARFGASSDRPGLRPDLVIRKHVQMGEANWILKNSETQKLFSFEQSNWAVIELFDGTRTTAEILEEYRRRYPGVEIDLRLVLEYEESLRKMDLLAESQTERHLRALEKSKTARQRAADEKAEGFNIFFLMFKVFDPDRFLNRTIKYVSWLWSPPAVAIACVFFALTVGVFVQHFGPIWDHTVELYSFLKKPFLDLVQFFIILTVIGCVHEFGHGYVTKRYGGEVHDMGLALLYFTPAFYCDTTDQYLFESKWHRIWVAAAGIYVEALLCCLATGLWVASYPDTLLYELAYKTMLYTGVSTVFFQINPLIKTDGYHALTSLIELPQLREDSFQYLGALFQKYLLRLRVDVPVLTRRRRRIYVLYATLAMLYTGSIMLLIGHIFYNFYSKYFADLAVVLLILTLYRLFRKRVRLVVRVAKLFYLDKKEWLMSPRNRTRLLVAGAALLLVLGLPWSRRTIQGDVVLRPPSIVSVQAPDEGTIVEVLAGEGDAIREGQVIAVLQSPMLQSGNATLAAERDRLMKRASARREAGDPGGVFQAGQQSSAVEALLRENSARLDRMSLRSPVDGRVLTRRMEDWKGRFVQRSTTVAQIGERRTLLAEIPVSERLLTDLKVGAPVVVQLKARPGTLLHGTVAAIAPATQDLPATSGGRDELVRPPEIPDRFVATARLDNPEGWALPGMSGRAKVRLDHSSYLARSWRVLRWWAQRIVW